VSVRHPSDLPFGIEVALFIAAALFVAILGGALGFAILAAHYS